MSDSLDLTPVEVPFKQLRSDGTDGRKKGSLLPGTPRHPNASMKKGGAARLKALREFCNKLKFEAEFPIANGESRTITISEPAHALAYMAMIGRDPLEKRMNSTLGEKSPYAAPGNNYVNGSGEVVHVAGYLDWETRINAARLLIGYMFPKLTSIEISGEDGANIFENRVTVVNAISRDPEIRTAFEKIEEKMAIHAVENAEDNQ